MKKTITLEPVTRIEGHAKVTLDYNETGVIERGHLQVLELRGFEKLVEGMELVKMPLITGRICGICPVAHHLASVQAIENGCGVTIPDEALKLRELLYLGHILHSHALSCFVLTGPDLLAWGEESAEKSIFRMLADAPDLAKKALRLRSIGQKTVEKIGGRGIHPVTAVPGGMSSRPNAEDVETICSWSEEAVPLLMEMYPVLSGKIAEVKAQQPQMQLGMKAIALTRDKTLSFLDGEPVILNENGTVTGSFTADTYKEQLREFHMRGSYMKSVRLQSGESYFVGPLARLAAAETLSTPEAASLLAAFKSKTRGNWSAPDNIEARLIEMVYCAERMKELVTTLDEKAPLTTPCNPEGGTFRSIIEAPRGLLIHDYTADENGHISAANLIVATQNNYDAIDAMIGAVAGSFPEPSENNDRALFDGIEFAIRCFDPCLSCATHAAGRMALQLTITKNGSFVRSLTRR